MHSSSLGPWFISRYADAHALLRDRRLGRDFGMFLDAQMGESPLRLMLGRTMLFNEPPHHTRSERWSAKPSHPASSKQWHRASRRWSTRYSIGRADGPMDVIADLAYPLPVQVICDMVGIPRADHALLRTWSRDSPPRSSSC